MKDSKNLIVGLDIGTSKVVAVVAELGCEMAQGFFIGRPMRGDLVPEWINQYVATASNARVRVPRAVPAVVVA